MSVRRPTYLPGPVRPGQAARRRPAGRDRRRRLLVQAAVQVPATGHEVADWQLRGLSEIVTQSLATGDDAIIRQVDAAAAKIAEGGERFVDRLRQLRRAVGAVPARYPRVRREVPATTPPSATTIAAAVRYAYHADRFRPDTCRPEEVRSATQVRTNTDVAAVIEAMISHRPDPRRGHGHRPVPVDARLVWRTWFMGDDGPFLGFPAHGLTDVAADLMFGLHVGVHLDHLAVLHEQGCTGMAHRLQFGRGLLVAESVAIAVELLHLAGVPADPAPAVRAFLYRSVVDRLARLPAIQQWGPAAAPRSPTMAAAAAHANLEFRTLPTLAAAYVHGPVHLAKRGFDDEFVPDTLRRVLRAGFRDPRMAGLVLPAPMPVA